MPARGVEDRHRIVVLVDDPDAIAARALRVGDVGRSRRTIGRGRQIHRLHDALHQLLIAIVRGRHGDEVNAAAVKVWSMLGELEYGVVGVPSSKYHL